MSQTVIRDRSIPGQSQGRLSAHLARLEAESIYILREAAAEFERPTILYSIGKDSSALLHLARHEDSRGCLALLDAILETPGLAERLFEVLKPAGRSGRQET